MLSGRTPLLRYTTAPDTPAFESPKPYLHPVRTLAGESVTAARPHDHPWHAGLQFTAANLSGQNFWGGRTYVRDQGYTRLDNNGSMRHVRWVRASAGDDGALLRHQVEWLTAGGDRWIDEDRRLRVELVDPADGSWLLTFHTELRNVSGQDLSWGSPVTEGRATAGYGGLFWRGPRSFVDGEVLTRDGLSVEAAMGSRGPWLAYVGTHDMTMNRSTLVFVDSPGNPRFPTPWFVRNTPYPVVSFAGTFHERLTIPSESTLSLTHHIVIADGAWDTDRIEHYVTERIAPLWT